MVADLVDKLDNVAQELLGDALAGGVDAELHLGGRDQHRRGKHRHADGLAKATRRADEHLLCEVVPAVAHEHVLVVSRKSPGFFGLPEDPCASLLENIITLSASSDTHRCRRQTHQKVFVEKALMKAAVPAALVEALEHVAAVLHALEGRPPASERAQLALRCQARLQAEDSGGSRAAGRRCPTFGREDGFQAWEDVGARPGGGVHGWQSRFIYTHAACAAVIDSVAAWVIGAGRS